MRRRISLLVLLPALLLSLSGCGSKTDASPAPSPVQTSLPVRMPADFGFGDIPGEDAQAPLPPADSYEGRYYNDYLRLTLALDGRGSCTLTGSDTDAAGTYTLSDGRLLLDFGTRQETAAADGDGDITIDGRSGYFLRNWSFWHITEAEAGTAFAPAGNASESLQEADGGTRFRDFENHIAFTYTQDITVLPDLLIGAAAATDGQGGFVSGRNVTDSYFAHIGTDDEFIEDYVKTYVFADFDVFYGGISGFDSFSLAHDGIEGRLADASLHLYNAENDISARVILYTSTYADGTANYICKSIFAPTDNEVQAQALGDAVSGMGAVRIK